MDLETVASRYILELGVFPCGMFATVLTMNDRWPPAAVPGMPQYMDKQFLLCPFLFVALAIMFRLLIA